MDHNIGGSIYVKDEFGNRFKREVHPSRTEEVISDDADLTEPVSEIKPEQPAPTIGKRKNKQFRDVNS